MMRLRNSIYLLRIVALIAAPLAFISKPAAAQETYNCLPTCEENDARFLSVAGVGRSTVAAQPITLTFRVPEALSPSGNYFYRLVISPATSGMIYLSNFKVRTNATVMLAAQPFSYLAPMLSPADRAVVYPRYPNLTPTTYDGRFNFHFFAPGSMPSL